MLTYHTASFDEGTEAQREIGGVIASVGGEDTSPREPRCRWGRTAWSAPTSGNDSESAHACFGLTVTTVSPGATGPGCADDTSPNFFLFVTTMGVIVS